MIDIRQTLVDFLSACCNGDWEKEEGSGRDDNILLYGLTTATTMPLIRGAHVAGDFEQSKARMRVLPEAMKAVVIPLQECELKRLVVRSREAVQ